MSIIIYICSNHESILSKCSEFKNCMLETLQKDNSLYEINENESLMLSKSCDFYLYFSKNNISTLILELKMYNRELFLPFFILHN